ncbi:hypothetical protein CYMTET_19361 [Cymbomonas tetramitiformis]|uniref:Uncharacterized protein n=1 Tax=Cymbomonas tetramitiformis TaxID=36881 RepID=A0AAE0L4Z0_9CHLO|nr:hypothetical protein CYMTET_19361 [Cymbomonas tetramitiformis]
MFAHPVYCCFSVAYATVSVGLQVFSTDVYPSGKALVFHTRYQHSKKPLPDISFRNEVYRHLVLRDMSAK